MALSVATTKTAAVANVPTWAQMITVRTVGRSATGPRRRAAGMAQPIHVLIHRPIPTTAATVEILVYQATVPKPIVARNARSGLILVNRPGSILVAIVVLTSQKQQGFLGHAVMP